MSMSVCVFVCMCVWVCVCVSVCPRAYLANHTRNLHQIFWKWSPSPWLGPPPAGDEIPKGRGNLGGFLPHWQCIGSQMLCFSIAFGTHTKNGWTDRDNVWDEDSGGRRNHVLDGVQIPQGKGQFLGLSGPFKSIGNLRCSRCFSVMVAFATKGIIQSPITSCSRRDHSVCQDSANSILKISGCRRCGLLAAKGVVALYSAGEFYLALLFVGFIRYIHNEESFKSWLGE